MLDFISESSERASLQSLSDFRLPKGFRGRSAFYVQLWWIVQALLVRTSPQFLYGWRRQLFRIFGAKIGKHVLIRPTVTMTYPWKIVIGDDCWIGDHVTLYSLGEISIGNNVVISQHSYLCAASHDCYDRTFAIYAAPINVEDEVWIASHCYIAPGLKIGRGAVIGARSVVLKNVDPAVIAAGHPAKVIGKRSPATKIKKIDSG